MFKKMWKVNEKKRKNQNFVLNETLTTKTATWSGLNRLARKLEFKKSVANQQQQQ